MTGVLLRSALCGLILAASVACSRSAPVPETASPYRPTSAAEIRISLERTTCFGSCPAYTVSVDAAGHVRYQGDRYVAQAGAHEWQVDPQVVEHLLKLFERVRFLETGFDCERTIYDAPYLSLTLRSGERERTIRNQWLGDSEFGPLGLGFPIDRDLDSHALYDWLGNWIDTALGTEAYVKGEKPR